MNKIISIAALLLLPFVSHAQGVQTFLTNIVAFFDDTLIPALLAIGFLFFVINAIRFFVADSSNEQGREKAKALAIYGVLAFVLIVVFWGIVNLLSSSIGLEGENQPEFDYVREMTS